MTEWQIQLTIEFVKIAIFLCQLVLLGVLVSRQRDLREGLEEVRQELARRNNDE
jgi:hypothetical protein